MPSPKAPSAKLLARRAAKVVFNRAALDELTRAVMDGGFELAKMAVFGANVPDAEPYGVGLVQGGGVIAYVDKKLVATTSTGSDTSVKKPSAARLGPGIVVIGGFGFPGRFQEAGTIHQPARPFLTPSLMKTLPGAENFIRAACIKRKVISGRRTATGAEIQASRTAEVA